MCCVFGSDSISKSLKRFKSYHVITRLRLNSGHFAKSLEKAGTRYHKHNCMVSVLCLFNCCWAATWMYSVTCFAWAAAPSGMTVFLYVMLWWILLCAVHLCNQWIFKYYEYYYELPCIGCAMLCYSMQSAVPSQLRSCAGQARYVQRSTFYCCIPAQGMSLRKVTSLGSNMASVTDLKRIETAHSLCCDFGGYKTLTTRWSGCTVQVWVQVQAPAGHLAISPKAVPEGNRMFRGQNRRPSSWGRSPAVLVRVGRASTNTGRFRVCGSRCRPRPARLRKTCYHSCNTDWVQEPIRF